MEAILDTVGDRIKARRDELGMSQADLARAVQVDVPNLAHQTAIARIERDERDLRVQEVPVVARALGVSASWLSYGAKSDGDLYADGYRDGLAAALSAVKSLTDGCAK